MPPPHDDKTRRVGRPTDDRTTPIDGRNDDETIRREPTAGHDETVIIAGARGESSSGARRIGHYRLVSELGQGGQGAVYLAEDERIRRKVALKVLFGGSVHSTEARLRFEREAEVTGRLNDPGIARIHEMDEVDGVPFIAMEFVEGQPLSDRLREAAQVSAGADISTGSIFDFEAEDDSGSSRAASSSSTRPRSTTGQKGLQGVARFIESAARALHVAHEAGLVHRDIKPGNIMVRDDGSPCILDFGLAHDEASVGVTLTGSRDRFGTPAYMAPEQVRGQVRVIDRRTDVWALGATLYQCCTLKRPFEAPTLDELYERIKHEEPRPPRSLNPGIPKDLEAVILTALDKDQTRRYAGAEDLAEDLRRFRTLEPVLARPAGKLVKALRWVQRNRGLTAAALVVFLALITSTVVFVVKERDARRALDDRTAALRAKDRALESETAALEQKSAALVQVRSERDRVTRLKDRRVLRRLHERADDLYPAHPDLIGDLEDWLDEADELLARLQQHRESLVALEATAGPYTDARKAQEHPDAWPRLVAARARLAAFEDALDDADSEAAEQRLEAEADRVDEEIAALQEQVAERRSWGFDDEDAWLHELLRDLVPELEAFGAPDGVVAGVRKRLATSGEIAPRTLEDHAEAWKAACARIPTSDKYGGLDLEPQIGLIPLGPDPSTGLEEFLNWASHARGAPLPERGAEGRFEVETETGVILVLLPGGTFLMGAQSEEPAQPNHDPGAQPEESPVHEVTLSPFLIGKYEVTRGQYVRMSETADPSYWNPQTSGGLLKSEELPRFPVERVDWSACEVAARRGGLTLPTEARWEYACRAGSDEVYFFGDDPAGLPEFANVQDRQWSTAFNEPSAADFDDGHAVVAPVGSLEPNAFGLHDVHGNVNEWCADWDDAAEYGRRREGCTDPPGPASGTSRLQRGGSWYDFPRDCRSSGRCCSDQSFEGYGIGFRVARNLDR